MKRSHKEYRERAGGQAAAEPARNARVNHRSLSKKLINFHRKKLFTFGGKKGGAKGSRGGKDNLATHAGH